MELKQKIADFVQLGQWVQQTKNSAAFEQVWQQAHNRNSWFDAESVASAFTGVAAYLQKDELERWLANYPKVASQPEPLKQIGVVMAGNIPLVGFHDYLTVLLSGNKLVAKPSSNDDYLLKLLHQQLVTINSAWAERVVFQDSMKEIDALIATGSDNTARYFEYYFKNKPHLIRKNRTAVAVLNGNESAEALEKLSADIFTYYGLGCRNVSKVFVPKGYDTSTLLAATNAPAQKALQHHKYNNNFEYNLSLYLINGAACQTNDALIVVPSKQLLSPISVLFYEHYASAEKLKEQLAEMEHKLQCVLSDKSWFEGSLPLGTAQQPSVTDYADGVDTLKFLLEL